MTDTLRRLMRTPQGALGSVLLVALVLACVLGGAAAPYQPEAMDFAGRFAAQLGRPVELANTSLAFRFPTPAEVVAAMSAAGTKDGSRLL